mmetsp:Transcript_7315/g.29317  ORF Transcript_7315/g.29317 Transcript_7315/m.29317 type:complete len:249 (-) Transcript_7315:947-1693(-)
MAWPRSPQRLPTLPGSACAHPGTVTGCGGRRTATCHWRSERLLRRPRPAPTRGPHRATRREPSRGTRRGAEPALFQHRLSMQTSCLQRAFRGPPMGPVPPRPSGAAGLTRERGPCLAGLSWRRWPGQSRCALPCRRRFPPPARPQTQQQVPQRPQRRCQARQHRWHPVQERQGPPGAGPATCRRRHISSQRLRRGSSGSSSFRTSSSRLAKAPRLRGAVPAAPAPSLPRRTTLTRTRTTRSRRTLGRP